MATVSFNMTRVAGWTVSDLLFLLSGAAVLVQLLNQDERYLTPGATGRGHRSQWPASCSS